MIKLYCCHNLLELQGTIWFDSASQRVKQNLVVELYWASKWHTNSEDRNNDNNSIIVILLLYLW